MTQSFAKRDQSAPQLVCFSSCIMHDEDAEPSGLEGPADVRVIRVISESARWGQPVRLGDFEVPQRPGLSLEMHFRAPSKPRLVHAAGPAARHRAPNFRKR